MSKQQWWLVGGAVGLAVLLACGGVATLAGLFVIGRAAKDAAVMPEDRTPVATLSAGTVLEEFKANGVAFEQKYKGKFVAVTGFVDEVGTTENGWRYVVLARPPLSFNAVRCLFRSPDAVAKLSKGQPVTICGKMDGQNKHLIDLSDCNLR